MKISLNHSGASVKRKLCDRLDRRLVHNIDLSHWVNVNNVVVAVVVAARAHQNKGSKEGSKNFARQLRNGRAKSSIRRRLFFFSTDALFIHSAALRARLH